MYNRFACVPSKGTLISKSRLCYSFISTVNRLDNVAVTKLMVYTGNCRLVGNCKMLLMPYQDIGIFDCAGICRGILKRILVYKYVNI